MKYIFALAILWSVSAGAAVNQLKCLATHETLLNDQNRPGERVAFKYVKNIADPEGETKGIKVNGSEFTIDQRNLIGQYELGAKLEDGRNYVQVELTFVASNNEALWIAATDLLNLDYYKTTLIDFKSPSPLKDFTMHISNAEMLRLVCTRTNIWP